MSKQYELTGAQTYATVEKVFKAGERYSEAELGDLKDAVLEDEETPLFSEASAEKAGKRVTIGKAKAQAGEVEGGEGNQTLTV